MSGIFLPVAAESNSVNKMIFLAAIIPSLTVSPMQMIRRDMSMFNPDWIGKDPTRDPAVAREFLFHDCSPEIVEWALTTMRLMIPQRILNEPLPIMAWPEKPSEYIVCSQDRTIKPEWSRREAGEQLGVKRLEIAAGHCPHVSRPAEVAELLHGII